MLQSLHKTLLLDLYVCFHIIQVSPTTLSTFLYWFTFFIVCCLGTLMPLGVCINTLITLTSIIVMWSEESLTVSKNVISRVLWQCVEERSILKKKNVSKAEFYTRAWCFKHLSCRKLVLRKKQFYDEIWCSKGENGKKLLRKKCLKTFFYNM